MRQQTSRSAVLKKDLKSFNENAITSCYGALFAGFSEAIKIVDRLSNIKFDLPTDTALKIFHVPEITETPIYWLDKMDIRLWFDLILEYIANKIIWSYLVICSTFNFYDEGWQMTTKVDDRS